MHDYTLCERHRRKSKFRIKKRLLFFALKQILLYMENQSSGSVMGKNVNDGAL